MMFPHLTRQQITIDGPWQTTEQHRRLTGTLSSSAPFVILSLLHCGETYHYMKHTKCHDLDVSFVWYHMQFPGVDRYQHTVTIAQSVNVGASSEGRVCLAAPLPITFASGALVTCAMDRQSQPFLSLLAIAKVDIASKRNEIWVLKPRLVASLPEMWQAIFSKTRHGFIRIEEGRKAEGRSSITTGFSRAILVGEMGVGTYRCPIPTQRDVFSPEGGNREAISAAG